MARTIKVQGGDGPSRENSSCVDDLTESRKWKLVPDGNSKVGNKRRTRELSECGRRPFGLAWTVLRVAQWPSTTSEVLSAGPAN